MKWDFKTNTVVKDINTVPVDFRGLYRDVDGEFKLGSDDPAIASAVAAITGLNEALTAARAEAKANKQGKIDLSPLSDYGATVEEIAAGITSKINGFQEELAKGGDAKLNLEKVKADFAKEVAKGKEASTARIAALLGQLEQVTIDNEAKSAIAEAKGDVDLLLPFVRKQVKSVEEDGQFNVYVVDGEDRRFSGVTGQAMSIKELVTEMKGQERYGKLFESDAKSGPGLRPGQRAGKPVVKKDDMSSVDKIALGLQQGQHKTGGLR